MRVDHYLSRKDLRKLSVEGGKLTVFHELRNGLMKDPAKVYGRGTGNGVGKGPELEVTNSARSEETKMLKTAGSHRASCSPRGCWG